MELLIVIAAAVVLAGLLVPALEDLRENAHRVVCSSNQRQIGLAMFMYERDYNSLPYSSQLDKDTGRWMPRELNIAHMGGETPMWDGIGLLFQTGYCRSPNCFYCPSHVGNYRAEDHLEDWYHPGDKDLYTNFHYSGDVDWEYGTKRDLADSLMSGERMILLTDALSSRWDMNHSEGLNMLYADGSVHWREGLDDIEQFIPLSGETTMTQSEIDRYEDIWTILENGGAILSANGQ